FHEHALFSASDGSQAVHGRRSPTPASEGRAMSHRDLEPLPPDVEKLLGEGAHGPPPSSEAAQRLLSRLEASLGLAAAGTGQAAPAGSSPASPPDPAVATPAAAKHILPAVLTKPIPLAVTMFALGAGAGAAFHAALDRSSRPAAVATVSPPSPERPAPAVA